MKDPMDVVIVGAGIIGLSTAWAIVARSPGIQIVVIEKEPRVAMHQTGRNSGVIHSGIYYTPGSAKANLCRDGKKRLENFCQSESIVWEACGKVIVAVDETEIHALEKIYERGLANDVSCRMIDQTELKSLEPHANGIAAIHVTETGIVDYPAVCSRLVEKIRQAGGEVRLETGFRSAKKYSNRRLMIGLSHGKQIESKALINCSGLYADKVMEQCGVKPTVQIVPFRGEYFQLDATVTGLCRNLIYPVPDPAFPFLGVHFTRMVHGGVECGPNAVLALSREGYSWSDIKPIEALQTITYPGFLKLAKTYWRMGAGEIRRSLSKDAFAKALQRLVPEIRSHHLTRIPAGVRAQAVDRDGKLVDDFLIVEHENMLHVLNAPSPAATASLAIGEHIADKFLSMRSSF